MMHAVCCKTASSHCILTTSRDFYPKIQWWRVENFDGVLELKRLHLTWSGQVDLMVTTPRPTDTQLQHILH